MKEPGVKEELQAQMAAAERKAWDALSRYKFWMFGYYASQWVTLNRLTGQPRPSPFQAAVHLARQMSCREPVSPI